MSLPEFGETLVDFAPYISDFADEVKSIKPADVAGAMDAVTLIVTTMSAITGQESSKNALSTFGKELEKFGKSLINFYNQMVKVDFSKVNSITGNVRKLVKVAQEASKETVEGFLKSFNNIDGSIKNAVNKMINTARSTLKSANSKFTLSGREAGKKFVDGITWSIQNNLTSMKRSAVNLGKNYAMGLANGIRTNTTSVISAAKYMAEQADKEVAKTLDIHSPSKVAEKKGKWYDLGLADGIARNTLIPVKSVKLMAERINRELTNTLDFSAAIAKFEAFTNSFSRKMHVAEPLKHITNVVAALQLKLYGLSKPMEFVAAVVEQGFLKMTKTVAKGYSNIAKLQAEYDQNVKAQEKAAEKEEKEAQKKEEEFNKWVEYYSKTAKERAEAAKEAKKQAAIEAKAYAKVYGEAKYAKNDFLNFNDAYYQKLYKLVRSGNNKILYEDKTLEEAEIDILQRVTDAYNSYLEKYEQTRESIMNQKGFFDEVTKKEADVNVNLFSEVSKNEAKSKEELFQIAQDQIALYQNFVTTQGALISRLEGTALADYIRELGVDAFDQLQIINEMTQQELMEYAQLYEATYKSIEATTKIDTVTKENLIQNARDQVHLYEEFIKHQQELMVKLEGTNLGEYVLSLGVDSLEEMKAILSMSDAELTEYVGLYDQKFAAAGVAAKNQLKDTQKEIEDTILEILNGIVEKVNLWDWNFDGTMESLLGATKQGLKKAEQQEKMDLKAYAQTMAKYSKQSVGMPIGAAMAAGFNEENVATILKKKTDVAKAVEKSTKEAGTKNKPVAKKEGKELAKEAVNGLSGMKKDFFDIGVKAGGELADGLNSQIGNVQSAAASLAHAMSIAGQMASTGFGSGITSGVQHAVGAGRDLSTALVGSIRSTLSIHSPSRVTEELGEYAATGFISKLLQSVAKVAKAGMEMGEAAKDSIKSGMGDISNALGDYSLDWNPIIRPIVDLSEVEASVNDINRMFNDAINIMASEVQITAGSISAREARVRDRQVNETSQNVVNNFNFEQTNNSPKALSQIDIYRSTKNQFAQFREAVSRT